MSDARGAALQKSVKVCPAGTVVFHEGDPGDLMYVVLEGEVEILKNAQAGSAKVLTTLGKGEFFGEMALIDSSLRSATAKAKTDAKLLAMNEGVFDSYILTNPEFAVKMIRNLTKRLRGANKLIEQALAGNTHKVVLEGLAEFARDKGTATVKGLRVSVPAFADWASGHLGIPEKTVPDILRTLVERGVIVTSAMGENEVIYPQK
jgi:CRP/FNR family cyclic AMP-dependent transcriptional regulator